MFLGMSTKNSSKDDAARPDDPAIWPDGADPLRQSQLILDELSRPETDKLRAEELISSFDGHEMESSLAVFARLRDTEDAAELHAVSRLLARWAGTPVAMAIVPAMKAMLEEPDVGDLNKMTAAGLLEVYGQSVDYAGFLSQLKDLEGVAEQSLESMLRTAEHPMTASRFLERMAGQSTEQVLRFIDDCAGLADTRSVFFLRCLIHVSDPDIAVSALSYLEVLKIAAAADDVQRVARCHHDPAVREQAGFVLRSLRMEAGTNGGAAGPPTDLTRFECFGSKGDSILLISYRNDFATARSLLSLHIDEEKGIQGYALAEDLDSAGFKEVRAQFEKGGMPMEPISIEHAQAKFDQAVRCSMRAGQLPAAAPIPWLLGLGQVA